MLEAICNDRVSVRSKDGQVSPEFKAIVQPGKIFVMQSGIRIKSGDVITRYLSNGGEEQYEVVDPGFMEGIAGIPAHYQITSRLIGSVALENSRSAITVNLNGPNARINSGSIDNSYNVVGIDPALLAHLKQITSEIEKAQLTPIQKYEALETLDAAKTQLTSPSPSRAVIKALLSSLPKVGDIASIVSLIMTLHAH